jgi:alginate O-acetyltransferase complex protein AlgJ
MKAAVALIAAAIGVCGPLTADEAASRPGPDSRTEAFLCECAARAAAAEKAKRLHVPGRERWLFFSGELHYVGAGRFWGDAAAKVSRASKPEWADPTAAIVDFKKQLDKLGVELLVVPVPPKAIIYPDMLSDAVKLPKDGSLPRLDVHFRQFAGLLGEKGVDVVDLAPHFLAARKQDDRKGALYCRQDTHWSPRACELTAKLLAQRLAGREWLKAAKKLTLTSESREIQITGDLYRDARKAPGGEKLAKEKLRLRFVGTKTDAGLKPVESDRDSPVVLLGDSHCLVFSYGAELHGKGAGLADQLAMELGIAIDRLGVRGSGATPARIALYRRAAHKGYIEAKKLIIWCFAAREFTESSGWRKVPVVREAE